jgi:hypothetical protein
MYIIYVVGNLVSDRYIAATKVADYIVSPLSKNVYFQEF